LLPFPKVCRWYVIKQILNESVKRKEEEFSTPFVGLGGVGGGGGVVKWEAWVPLRQ